MGIDEMDMKRVTLDVTVCDYDLIGGGDPIGKLKLGWSQNKEFKPGFKHWKEALENPRRPIIKWHVYRIPSPRRMTIKTRTERRGRKIRRTRTRRTTRRMRRRREKRRKRRRMRRRNRNQTRT